jgi:glycosyltransferase involved in cell wall biosynthesis
MDERAELVRHARIVLAHSAFNRVRLDAGLGRPVEAIGYGVDVQRFRPDPEPPLSPDVAEMYAERERPRVVVLGPPTHTRGADLIVDLLLALQSRVDDIELVVAGRDPLNPVLQALACGVPVVAAPSGAVQDLVRHGEEGLIQPVQDLSSFAAAASSFVIDPIAHQVFSEAARARALELHDIERSVWAVEELYDRLRMGEHHRAAA